MILNRIERINKAVPSLFARMEKDEINTVLQQMLRDHEIDEELKTDMEGIKKGGYMAFFQPFALLPKLIGAIPAVTKAIEKKIK